MSSVTWKDVALLCTWYVSCRCLYNALLPTTHFHKASAYESQLSRTLTVSYQVVIVYDGAFHQVVQIFTGKKYSSTSHSKSKGSQQHFDCASWYDITTNDKSSSIFFQSGGHHIRVWLVVTAEKKKRVLRADLRLIFGVRSQCASIPMHQLFFVLSTSLNHLTSSLGNFFLSRL